MGFWNSLFGGDDEAEIGDCEICDRTDVKVRSCPECGRTFCIRCGYWPRREWVDENEPICRECINELRG